MKHSSKEPVLPPVKASRPRPVPLLVDQLLDIATNTGWAVIAANMAPSPFAGFIKPNAVVDCVIIVKQNCPKSVDDAECVAQTLCGDGGHYESHLYKGGFNRMKHPVIITYLNKS